MTDRKRPIVPHCTVTAEERALIEQKLARLSERLIGAFAPHPATTGRQRKTA